MKPFAFQKLALLFLFALFALPVLGRAADISGKWTRDVTQDGAVHHWALDIQKDKFTFRVTDADKKTVLYAKGDVKLDKCGIFTSVIFSNIQAGGTEDDLKEVEDERHCIYTLDGNTLTLAMNFDKDREKGPRIDVYTK